MTELKENALPASKVMKVIDYIEAHPELRSLPTEDMFSFRDAYEDVDDEEEEEEEEYWEEDEEYEEEDEY